MGHPMSGTVDTYSPRGFLYTLIFCTALAAVGGLVAYLSAPERLVCTRGDAGTVECRLTRLAASRVVIRDIALFDVSGVALEEPTPDSGIGKDDAGPPPLPRLRFLTADGWTFSAHGEGARLRPVLAAVTALIRGEGPDRVDADLPGTPKAHRIFVGVAVAGPVILGLWVLGLLFPALRPRVRR